MISLLLAASENNVIGKNNQLPWRLPADMRYFKKLTTDNVVIMGRKTFDSLGKPLANRINIIITRQSSFIADGTTVVHSLKEALLKAKEHPGKETFIIGGAEIYKQTLPFADRIYLTRIHHHFEGDAFFSPLEEDQWKLLSSENHAPDDKNSFSYSFEVYGRN